jgi:YggT family protein
VLHLRGYQAGPDAGFTFAWLVLLAPVVLVKIALYIGLVAILVHVVLSWLAPQSPMMPILGSLTRPMLRVFQRRIPPIGNVDLSPLIALIVIQLLLMLPVAWAEITLTRLITSG